jgi:NAD(P)H-flavin reductase
MVVSWWWRFTRDGVTRSSTLCNAQPHASFLSVAATFYRHDSRVQRVGFINADMVKGHMFPPSEDLQIVMCGPGPMCRALKPALASLGYTPEMVFSYM